MRSIMCPTGHRTKGSLRVGDLCGEAMYYDKHRNWVYCKEKLILEPVVIHCTECARGIIVDEQCSFCGAFESPHGEQFGHSRCGAWFDTLEEWDAHVYGAKGTTLSADRNRRLPKEQCPDQHLYDGNSRGGIPVPSIRYYRADANVGYASSAGGHTAN
jgi:hypothetical protein